MFGSIVFIWYLCNGLRNQSMFNQFIFTIMTLATSGTRSVADGYNHRIFTVLTSGKVRL